MATLFIASGPSEGRWFPLGKRTTVIGRDEGLLAQVVGEGISRKHFQIHFDEAAGVYAAMDMNSKNGVYVNGRRIEGPTPLKEDDLVRIGDTLLLFTMEEATTEENNALLYQRKRGERYKATQTGRPIDLDPYGT